MNPVLHAEVGNSRHPLLWFLHHIGHKIVIDLLKLLNKLLVCLQFFQGFIGELFQQLQRVFIYLNPHFRIDGCKQVNGILGP